ncbi:MAG: HAMP domain-containing histidine kinase [Polyangiaceae bacterium]|nr:HAMP domain-containing histidine kinase [Polyangiaceae bacterium]
MSVRAKLLIIVLFVSLVPLGVSAWTALGIHNRALDHNLARLHEAAAAQEAQRVNAYLQGLQHAIELFATRTISWHELNAAEREAALWLVYRAHDDIAVALLVDERRQSVIPAAYVTDAMTAEEPRHPRASQTLAEALSRQLPEHDPGRTAPAYGQPILAPPGQAAWLPVSLPLSARQSEHAGLTLAILLSLRTVCRPELKRETMDIRIVDSARRSLCAAQSTPALSVRDGVEPKHGPQPVVSVTRRRDGQQWLSAAVGLPNGWTILAEQPTATAYAASQTMRLQAGVWLVISLAIALTSGLLLSRGISVPVQRLVQGARELAAGNLEYRLELAGKDEFGRLALAFNQMATELAARDAENRQWNEELQQRVQERTRDIERYHLHLVQAEKEAIMAHLSAGVATEVNDPLTSILGAVQVLAARARKASGDSREARLLTNAEEGALRIRELVKRVQALAQRQPRSCFRPVVVGDLVGSAVGLVGEALAAANVELVRMSAEAIPPVLGNFTQLEQALLQLLSNSTASCSAARSDELSRVAAAFEEGLSEPTLPRHRIVVHVRRAESGAVLISISDDGVGVPKDALERIFEPFVTLRADSGAGLGLTIARRIVEEHGGKLWAEANERKGATFTLRLPITEAEGDHGERSHG